MKYLHYSLQLELDDLVKVSLDKQANVRLLDCHNYHLYRRGKKHNYYGGIAIRTPYLIRAPRAGRWHLVVDRGGCGGAVRVAVNISQDKAETVLIG